MQGRGCPGQSLEHGWVDIRLKSQLQLLPMISAGYFTFWGLSTVSSEMGTVQ